MYDQYNFFAEADPQYIFAYMDSLSFGAVPKTGENIRDPFFLTYDFMKNELVKCRNREAQLIQTLEQEKRTNQAGKDFAMAKNTLCESINNKGASLMAPLVHANRLSSWLERRFFFSRQFPLFSQSQDERMEYLAQFASLAEYGPQPAGVKIKDAVWEQYMVWIGVHSMQEILDCFDEFESLIGKLKDTLKPWYAHVPDFKNYFMLVINLLDEFARFDPCKTTLNNFLSQKNRKSGKFFEGCLHKDQEIEAHLKHRSKTILDLQAFIAASMADPGAQITNALYWQQPY